MQRKDRKKIRDLVEMLEDPENSRYVGEDMDEMDIYDQELAELEELDEEEFDEELDSDDQAEDDEEEFE